MRSTSWFLLILMVVCSSVSFAQSHFWIFFRDKGHQTLSRSLAPSLGISDRALWRRSKVLPPDKVLDERDLPVSSLYQGQVRATGATIITASRWLNAVSIEATAQQVDAVRQLPSVSKISPVAILKHPRETFSPVPRAPSLFKSASTTLQYGPSVTQLSNIHVVDVHNLGIYGEGTIVGMIDNGFNRHRTHDALKNITVLNEYDFIHRIPDTEHQPWEGGSQGWHGAATLSAVGGYAPDTLIGAAFGASFILAKTEMDSTEVPAEEDLYIEALEWMEQLGADVVSTSLGYDDFVPSGKYNPGDITYSMKDGHTAVISIAASAAASKGVLLVTAMGNEGPWKYDPSLTTDSLYRPVVGTTGSLITPADADSIIAVGATYSDGLRVDFSSTGPTADGRTKPEVVAQGVSVVAADATTNSTFAGVSGTSLSTPLTAGAAALLFSAHPEATPMQVRDALMNTASKASSPDNYYGHGMVNAFNALLSLGIAMSNQPMVTLSDTAQTVYISIVSDASFYVDSLRLHYIMTPGGPMTEALLTPAGAPNLFSASIPLGTDSTYPRGFFSARDGKERVQVAPYGAPDSLFVFSKYIVTSVPGVPAVPDNYVLNANYPNPFNGGTTITFNAPRAENVELIVYDILGKRIRTLFRGSSTPGRNVARWNGIDERGNPVASGVYFVQLRTSSSTLTHKMLLLR